MSVTLNINLKRASKIYHEGETIAGVVVVDSSADVRHEGLTLTMEGSVNLQLSTKTIGIFEAFSNSIKPITLINTTLELAPAGKIPAGVTEIPFEIPLVSRSNASGLALLETYHGVFVNVMYNLKCCMKRSFLNKPLNTTCQFFVQYKHQDSAPIKPVRCEINPTTVRGGANGGGSRMPAFHIYAELDSIVCPLDKPLTGKGLNQKRVLSGKAYYAGYREIKNGPTTYLRVDECSVGIKSIELQLVRVETCGCAEGYSKDATEIQNIQVGEGDVRRGATLPLYMVLPRLFTCPTTAAANFKIEFELNIAVIFEDNYLVTENFPILLVRSR
ncbi:vacuolar protein sorting-associated protein 26C isoform X1 [Aricia agestis]|uniref:vacuolar protein sorting-associated protein 26C isoform X1 n=1 Tax=Aricia agestis TaxID=91739 RepID=UPI001C206F40|nr:vacuolar protein sorting-associated protein 26C isoform X1 [Aricia agestis]